MRLKTPTVKTVSTEGATMTEEELQREMLMTRLQQNRG